MVFQFRLSTAILSALILTSGSAYAGFEWVPSQPVQAQPSASPNAPVIVSDDSFVPMPSNNADLQSPTASASPAQPVPQQSVLKVKTIGSKAPETEPSVVPEPIVETVVVVSEDAPSITKINPFPVENASAVPYVKIKAKKPEVETSNASAYVVTPKAETDVVVGFGSDIPLALALQQIAPAGYTFSFGESVNPGAKVSWNGGKSWQAVMDGMLTSLGLTSDIQGNIIAIHYTAKTYDQTYRSTPTAEEKVEPAPSYARSAITDPMEASSQQPISLQASQSWSAHKGDSLKDTLKNWADSGSFQIEWQAMHDFSLAENIDVSGDLRAALSKLSSAGVMEEIGPKMVYVVKSSDQDTDKLIIKDRAPS